ncbi:hypothetical protein C8R47DRAFT_1209788 [Mycena vitilis]|nr:hypothetical protein C8R47DRAFT_1209788 [Mycena vitilis]
MEGRYVAVVSRHLREYIFGLSYYHNLGLDSITASNPRTLSIGGVSLACKPMQHWMISPKDLRISYLSFGIFVYKLHRSLALRSMVSPPEPGIPSSMDSEDIVAMLYGQWFTDAWTLIPGVILIYDHALTLESEIKFVWGKPKRLSFYLFVILRYASLLSNVGMVMLRFGNVPLEELTDSHARSNGHYYFDKNFLSFPARCHILSVERIGLGVVVLQCALTGSILALRVYTMYNFSKTVLVFLTLAGMITVVLAVVSIPCGSLLVQGANVLAISQWSITGERVVVTQESGCEYPVPKRNAIRGCTMKIQPGLLKMELFLLEMAGAWEAQLLCDVIVFVFTVIRSYREPFKTPSSLLNHMARDGALYFAVLALVNLANILMFYLGNVKIGSGFVLP